MDWGILISIISLIYAIKGDLLVGISFVNRHFVNYRIRKLREEIDFIERLSNQPSFLIAHVSKYLFILLFMVVFAILWNLNVPSKVDFKNFDFIFTMLFAWILGHVSGTGYRYCRYVIRSEHYVNKFNRSIRSLGNRLPNVES